MSYLSIGGGNHTSSSSSSSSLQTNTNINNNIINNINNRSSLYYGGGGPNAYYPNGSYYNGPDYNNVAQPPAHLLTICTMLYVLIFLMGLCGNTAVIVVVVQCRSMRTSINKLFLNLCIADLLALMITGPTLVVDMYMKETWHLGPVMCKLVTFLENIVGNASAATILAISVERFRVACRASTNNGSSCNQVVSFLTIWVASVLGAGPILKIVTFQHHEFSDGTPANRCVTPIDIIWKKVYIVVITILFFILPLLLILCLYTKVYLRLMQLFRREQEMKRTYLREIVILKRQMTQIIVTVVLVFFICHTPFRAFVLWSVLAPPQVVQELNGDIFLITVYLTRLLWYSNHAINPFVYNFVSRKFRRALMSLVCKPKRRSARFDEWKELVKTMRPIRMESIRRQRLSTAGRLFDIDNNIRDNKDREDPQDPSERHSHSHSHSHFQRNDFLVLYENLVLE